MLAGMKLWDSGVGVGGGISGIPNGARCLIAWSAGLSTNLLRVVVLEVIPSFSWPIHCGSSDDF